MMFNQYPYINVNDLNLDYILSQIKTMMNEVTNFVSINAIKYANPIQWDITRQYEKNTVVIDPVTGTAYISVAPVPAGVALTRPEYWTVVFDLGSFVTRAAKNFSNRYEAETTLTATFNTAMGEWLVWGDTLYKALVNITAGDSYVVDSNIQHITVEDVYNEYLNTIATVLAIIGDLVDLNTPDTTSVVNAINSVVTIIGDLANLTTSDTSDIVHAINSVLSDLNFTIGDLANLTTSDTSDIVHAINSVKQDVNDIPTTLKYLLAGSYNHEPIPEIYAEYIVDYESLIGTRPFNQGGCADDDYYYQFLTDSTDTYSWCYRIAKANGAITKYLLSVGNHYNGACVFGNYILTVHANDMYVFNKSNMILLYHHTIAESYAIAAVDNDRVALFDGVNIIIYDMTDIASPSFISTTPIQTTFTQIAVAGMVFVNDVLLIGGWTNTNQSSIIYAYELNGNLITTLTLPTNDAELESIAMDGNKLILMYQRQWNQAFCSCAFKSIDLYNLQTSVSALDEGDSYGVGTYNCYVDSTYTGFYVDGTSAKPFVSLNYAAQFIERIVANEKILWVSGTHGYVTFSKTGDNIIVRGSATLKRITAYCKSLQTVSITIDASSYAGECIFARNCNLVLNNSTFIAQASYHCINTAYGQVFVTNACTFSGGDYGLYAQFCSAYIGASLTDGGVINKVAYFKDCQVVSNVSFEYDRAASNIIIVGSFNPEDFTITVPSAIPAGSYIDLSFNFTHPRLYPPRIVAGARDNDGANVSAVITATSATSVNVRVYNNGANATIANHTYVYGLAIGI